MGPQLPLPPRPAPPPPPRRDRRHPRTPLDITNLHNTNLPNTNLHNTDIPGPRPPPTDDEDTPAARRERALAAIDLAALRDLDADLRALASDDSIDPRLRQAAFIAAAARCERDALPDWLALAVHDAPLFGPALLPTLRALHRRGIFIRDSDLPAILELTAVDPAIDHAALAAVCFTSRHALVRRLRAVPVDDPRWHRWLPLLAALDSPEVPTCLRELLAADPPPRLRRELLHHLGPLRDPTSEPIVLALLPREPAACLTTLQWIGGPATIACLRRDLGLDDELGPRPHLRADLDGAVIVLWQLLPEDDPTRNDLRVRLRHDTCPTLIVRDLGHQLALAELPLLLTHAGEPTAVTALARLANTGSRLALPIVRDLLRRIASEVVAGTLIDHHGVATRRAPTAPRASEAERRIPEPALAAIRQLGGRLRERNAIRPACLLAAVTPAQAGVLLLAELLLALAADADDPETIAIALHALAPIDDPQIGRQIGRRVHAYLRHDDPQVRAAAIVCLARHGVDDLCATLTRLAHSDDLPGARQALHALGEVGATAAAATIAGFLDHPNMNLKKTAAEALRRAGTPEVTPAIVRWLAQHDNPGLRSALSAALAAILGDATTTTLIAALDAIPGDDPDAARRRRLLVAALDHALTPAAVLAAARREAPWLPTLLTALADTTISLRSGSLTDLAAILPTPTITPEPPPAPRPAIARLLAHGFDHDLAAELLADPHHLDPHELHAIRPYLREWLAALSDPSPAHNLHTPSPAHNLHTPPTDNLHTPSPTDNLHTPPTDNLHTPPSPHAGALALILELAAAGLDAPEQALAADAIDALAARLDDGPREPLLALIDLLLPRLPPLAAWRLADRLRSSEPRPNLGGTSWLTRLRRCGVLLTRADLDRALHDCAATPDPAGLAREIVRDALALAPLSADEQALLHPLSTALREGQPLLHRHDLSPALRCELYPELPTAQRGAWLDLLLRLRPLGLPPPPSTPPRHSPPPDERIELRRLLARLELPEPRDRQRAAEALLRSPDLSARPTVLATYLAGGLYLSNELKGPLAAALAENPRHHFSSADHDPKLLIRIAALVRHFPVDDRLDHAPTLLRWWSHGPVAARPDLDAALRTLPAMRLLPHLEPLLRAGEWGHASLLTGPLLATPGWPALLGQAPPALAAALHARTVPGPLAGPEQHDLALAALAELRRPLPAPPPLAISSSPTALRERLHHADPETVRHALTDMSHAPGPDWLNLLDELIDHPSPRVRLHAHRLLRASGERERYLACTCRLLNDPKPDIQRMAMRSLAHAGHLPAVAPLVERLARDHDPLHREVVAALRRLGPLAGDALTHARNKARPDRRARHDELLAAIAADSDSDRS
ncbi:HEAT repeat domain-containing protein [Nannocystis sp.]|uniref:HEAT repeat domain-containing protein n=1 Tax=Nannocystis sp. TaxID=1962667 RepID=UPI0025E5C549|nr:HEAT repeat domain-containing protein [Nannocystis sp.]MBK7829153.1 HEAT repeat domain-containing protein [Nannocystis sp.]